MRKILFSLIMISAVVGVVTASAFALFTDKAQVQGVSITSGNADLKINGSNDINANWFTDNVYPGWVGGSYFNLKNDSLSKINLKLTAYLKNAPAGWDQKLKDKTTVALYEYSSEALAIAAKDAKNPGYGAINNTPWLNLVRWNSSPVDFGASLGYANTHYFVFWTTIDSEATSEEIAGNSLNSNWEITGTQI